MANKTYFFKHDYNARNDLKMKRLLKNYGGFGYGFYWYLVEMLHENEDSTLAFSEDDIDVIAEDLSFPELIVSADLLNNLLVDMTKYKLIIYTEGTVCSKRVFKNKEKNVSIVEIRRQIGSLGGKKKAENRKNSTKSLPIATNSLPIATNSLPIATKSLPIATKSLPIATNSLPIATPEIRLGLIQKELYQNKIYDQKNPTKKSSENVGTTSEVVAKASKRSKQDNTNTINKENNRDSSSSNGEENNAYSNSVYNISVPLQTTLHPIDVCLWNYFNNPDFKEARGLHCIRLNLDKDPDVCMDKLVPWAHAFNRGLVNDGKINISMSGGTDSWLKYFPAWCLGVINKRGYINPEILFTAEEINRPPEVSVDDKKKIFKSTLDPFFEKYGKKILNEFYKHWAEPDHNTKLLRWEMEKTWDVAMRLSKWQTKSIEFSSK